MRWTIAIMWGLVTVMVTTRGVAQEVVNTPHSLAQIGDEWIRLDCGTMGGFNAVWGVSRDEVYAVGMQGSVVKFDGRTCRPQVNGMFESLFGLWGTSSSDLWAVGMHGTIVHSDGGAWRPVQTNPLTENNLTVVWGSSGSDVFAVGENGTIVHFDGSSWRTQESGTQSHLWGIWGTSPSNVFVAGDGATLLYYDGARWRNLLPDYTDVGEVRALWGSAGSNVWIVADAPRGTSNDPDSGQASMDRAGVVFELLPGRLPTLQRAYDLDIWVSAVLAGSAGDAYLVAPPNLLLHMVGNMLNVVSASTPEGIRGLWRTRMDEFFVVNEAGLFSYRAP